ncbi:MAG: hypothetical protein ACE5D8_04970 [Fidelibacterota bacterium]
MKSQLIHKEILPFLALFGSLILATIAGDVFLHRYDLVWVGRWLGIPGVLSILLSFVYSLRKRKIISYGKPRTWLTVHEIFTLLGALLILIHAGIHFYAVLPWLALLAMLINIISGITGSWLLARSRRRLAGSKKIYKNQGLSPEEIERRLFWDTTSFALMKKWRAVHLPITVTFAGLSLIHILTIFLFWSWK